MKPAVLIVEDSMLISHHLEVLVESTGFEVCGICDTAEEAIKLAAIHKPSVIFMDVTLAGAMDGLTAARIIKGTQETEIIFLSALAAFGDLVGEGEFRCLSKPFDDTELLNFLEHLSNRLLHT